MRCDVEHGGTAAGFTFEVRWGTAIALHRDAAASDVLVTARADAGLLAAGARLSAQSWGTVLPYAASVATSPDDYTAGLTVTFAGKSGSASDTVMLRNYTVVRLP